MSQVTVEEESFPLGLDEEEEEEEEDVLRGPDLLAPFRSCSTASASMVFLERLGLGLKVWRHWGQL